MSEQPTQEGTNDPAADNQAMVAGSQDLPEYLKQLPVQVDVILGSVKLTVHELLSCGPGSVIDVGKKASDPFDLLVNNKLVARGEIVMMHDRLGLKITEVIDSPLPV